jgi:hypothetical protein
LPGLTEPGNRKARQDPSFRLPAGQAMATFAPIARRVIPRARSAGVTSLAAHNSIPAPMKIKFPLRCAFGLVLLALPGIAPAAASIAWVTVFDERFADNPSSRFKTLPVPVPGATSSGASMRYDEEHKAYSVAGYLALVRPVRAGAQASLDLRLRFEPPETNAPAEMVTAFSFVLFDRSAAGVEIERSSRPGVPVRVRFTQTKGTQPKPRILRELELENAKLDGEWQLGYRNGLLTLRQDGRALGGADTGALGAQVAGVTWTQMGGKVTCQGMTLTGEPLHEITPADQATLKQAASLNEGRSACSARARLRTPCPKCRRPPPSLCRCKARRTTTAQIPSQTWRPFRQPTPRWRPSNSRPRRWPCTSRLWGRPTRTPR